jgi:hypothetical protein
MGLTKVFAICALAWGCNERPQQVLPPPARSAGLAPAAHSAVGAYGVSGETPWAHEVPEQTDGPPATPPAPKLRRRGEDGGGVAL